MKEAGGLVFVGVRECRQPGVKLILRHVVRIVTGIQRLLFGNAIDKRLFLIEPRPRTIVDVKVVETLTAGRCLVCL